MSLLFPAFALLTVIAIGALVWPVFRRQPAVPRQSFEIEVYRDQLAEIERDRERGLIGPDEARAGQLEVERRLLRAASPAHPPAVEAAGGRKLLLLAAALLVPTMAAALYAGLGSPGLPDQPLAYRQAPPDPSQPDVQQMVAGLEARLAASPNDLEGWLMLARSRGVLGNAQGAVDASRRALALAPDDPRAIGGLGEALTDLVGGMVTPEAKGLFTRLSAVEPRDPRPDFYLGWADAQAGDNGAALDRWRRLLAVTPAEAPWRASVVEAIQAAAVELQLDPATVLAQIPTPPAAPRPSADEVAAAAAMPAEDRLAMIRGMVEKLQARMDADGSDVEGWLRLAQSRQVLGEGDRARATFEQALKLHPDNPALLKGYGGTLVGPVRADTGLPEVGDRANELFTKAASMEPDDPELWWYLGIRALQDGQKAAARSAWEKVLARLDPSRPEYKDVKSRLDGLGS